MTDGSAGGPEGSSVLAVEGRAPVTDGAAERDPASLLAVEGLTTVLHLPGGQRAWSAT